MNNYVSELPEGCTCEITGSKQGVIGSGEKAVPYVETSFKRNPQCPIHTQLWEKENKVTRSVVQT